MTEMQDTPDAPDEDHNRTPRVALMGEFSAGKSTLTNLLLGATPLPVKITATRLPPVWITYGSGLGLREDVDGEVHQLGPEGLDGIHMDDTRLIQLQMQSDILEVCDLVDMPGISDPNMDSKVWSGVVSEADVVVWCTHATQAWRQSEAAAFASLPEHLRKNAILLITRFDKLQSERDRKRVLARVAAETNGLFRAAFPVALLDAMAAGDDRERWDRSGAEPFLKMLLDMVTDPQGQMTAEANPGDAAEQAAEEKADTEAVEMQSIAPVRPVRVAPKSGGTPRPGRPGSSESNASIRSAAGNA